MTLFMSTLFSLFIGTVTGCIYGLLFVASKQKALFSSYSRVKKLSVAVGFSVLRFALFTVFLIYLLHCEILGSILALTSFLALFWLIIIQKGLIHHEGRTPT
jgi:ABC-type methionine transport system permease subunit